MRSQSSPPTSGSEPSTGSTKLESVGQPESLGKFRVELEQLFRSEHAKVVHCLVAKTGSWSEARDVAAQAFAQVLQLESPETVSFLKAYIYRAAKNIATDRAKSRAIRRRIDQATHQEYPPTTPSPESELREEQRLQVLQHTIDSFPPRVRFALTLRFWEDAKNAEIVAQFAQRGIDVNERTLRRWFADAFQECRKAIMEAERMQEGE